MMPAQEPRPAPDKVFEKVEMAGIYLDDGAPHAAARCLRQAADICDAIAAAKAAALAATVQS